MCCSFSGLRNTRGNIDCKGVVQLERGVDCLSALTSKTWTTQVTWASCFLEQTEDSSTVND